MSLDTVPLEGVAEDAAPDDDVSHCVSLEGPSSPGPRPGADVWSVLTRSLPGIGRMPSSAHVAVERLDESRCWKRSDVATLLENPRQPLVIFIHGNRYDHGSARQQGLLLAQRTAACCPEARGARTVIFSWPSDKQGILLRDSRAKYERAVSDGHYLAWLLAKVEPDRPVAIIGYSYGALVALEALEDLVAAEQAGRSDVHPWMHRTSPLHLVLVAAAVRHDALAPRGPYREVVPCIDRLTLLINSSDHALRFFELVDRGLRTEALGDVGMPASWLPRDIGFTQVDAAGIVGGSHRFKPYLASASLMRRICTGAGGDLICPADGPCQDDPCQDTTACGEQSGSCHENHPGPSSGMVCPADPSRAEAP